MMKIVTCYWWDEGDPEHLIYFKIMEKNQVFWESSWKDIRDLNGSDIDDLRKEVVEALKAHNMDQSLVDGDWTDWGKSQSDITS